VNLLLVKNTTMHGVFWGSYMARDYAALAGGMQELLGWVGAGRLAPQVSHRCVVCVCVYVCRSVCVFFGGGGVAECACAWGATS
jgi:hypothetical protein